MEKKVEKCKTKYGVSQKTFIALLALVLIIGCAVGGTVAWLVAGSDEVVNTFTYGDIKIKLWEHKYNAETNTLDMTEKVTSVTDYKIIPGKDLPKDPTVTVSANSEPCWLFVEVKEDGNFVTGKVSYTVDELEWTAGTDTDGIPTNVYYREILTETEDKDYAILAKNEAGYEITVGDSLTKEEVNNATVQPKLTFKAYAVQREGIDTAADAWKQAKPTP